jgi:antitoxin HicB
MPSENPTPPPDYPTLIRPLTAEEGGGYLVEFPDLPGCHSDGDTIPEAIAHAQEAQSA